VQPRQHELEAVFGFRHQSQHRLDAQKIGGDLALDEPVGLVDQQQHATSLA
jgi:hypothetical protein